MDAFCVIELSSTSNHADRRTHYDFFYIIRNILPCEMCKQHYSELIKEYPLEPFLDTRDSLISWVIIIHNQVNARLGKRMLTREEVLSKYQKAYERQSFCQVPIDYRTNKNILDEKLVQDSSNTEEDQVDKTPLSAHKSKQKSTKDKHADVEGHLSSAMVNEHSVKSLQTPWYKSIWMIILYIVILCVIISLLIWRFILHKKST